MTDIRARPKVALTIGDRDWWGWTSADIVQTMDAVTGSFSIGLTERWEGSPPGSSTRGEPPEISPGAACAVSVDGEPLITGYIDVVAPTYSAIEHGVTISGRDRTGDLVDCSAAVEPGEWHDIALAPLVAAIAKPFGINVYPDSGLDLGAKFPRFRVQPGETAWAAIERATRARAVLAVATPDGHLGLTRAQSRAGGNPPAIILGGDKATPVKATGTFEAQDRFSRYRILAQQGGEAGGPEDRAHVVATAEDPGVKRYRPLVIVASDRLDGAAKAAVQWEANVRRGRSRRAAYTIAGWRDDAGRLWRPNTIVRVTDKWLRINHDLLIVSVRLTIGEDQVETDLELADPSAYLREPPDPSREEATGRKKKKSTDELEQELRELGW